MSFKKTSILIIKGISLQEILAKDVKIIKPNPTFNYTPIPRKFTSVEEWLDHTNLLCWNCSLTIMGYPKFIPKNPSIVKGKPTCDPIGQFCHWSCAISFAKRTYSKDKYWDVEKLIILFANLFPDFHYKIIPAAPDYTSMKAYCGNDGLSAGEYQELMNKNLMMSLI